MLAIVVSGCITVTAPRDYTLTDGSREGLVIMSFTHPYRTLKWMYRDLTKGKGFRGGPTERWVMTNVTGVTEPIDDGDTRIIAVVLPQGEYEFYRWTESETFWYDASIRDVSVRLKSLAGKAVSIGDLLTRDDRQYWLMARDQRERQIPLFKAHYPNISDAQIETHLMQVIDSKKTALAPAFTRLRAR